MSDTQAVADKLIHLAKHVGGEAWPILVRYQFVSGLVNTVYILTYFVLLWIAWQHAPTAATWREWDREDEASFMFGVGALVVVLSVAGLIAFACLPDMVVAIINPSGAAIHALLKKE